MNEYEWMDYVEAMSVDEFNEWKRRVAVRSTSGRRIIAIEYSSIYVLGEDNPLELGRVIYGPQS